MEVRRRLGQMVGDTENAHRRNELKNRIKALLRFTRICFSPAAWFSEMGLSLCGHPFLVVLKGNQEENHHIYIYIYILGGPPKKDVTVGQNQCTIFGVGEFTTHFRTYFSGWIGMFTGG